MEDAQIVEAPKPPLVVQQIDSVGDLAAKDVANAVAAPIFDRMAKMREVTQVKVNRNAPCPCGRKFNGTIPKYKHCCMLSIPTAPSRMAAVKQSRPSRKRLALDFQRLLNEEAKKAQSQVEAVRTAVAMADAQNGGKMYFSEWKKTPYATSTAKNADQAVVSLLEKYGVKEYQWTRGSGPSGRPAVLLRWNFKGKTYRIMIETLDCQNANPDDLIRQVYRAMFFYLKSTLELAGVFFPLDTALFAFLELADGSTMYEMASPHLSTLKSNDLAALMQPALPAGRGG